MAAPTYVSFNQATSAFTATGATKSTASISWQSGDVLVAALGAENTNGITLVAPTVSGLTFSMQKQNNPGTASSTCASLIATAVAASSGSGVITSTATGSRAGTTEWGMGVWVWRGSAGVGNSAEQHTSTKTVSLTPTGADGAICWGVFDFAGGFTNTATPTATHSQVAINSANYDVNLADLADQVSSGAVSYGVTSSGTGPFSIVVVEVKAGAGGGSAFDIPQLGMTGVGF